MNIDEIKQLKNTIELLKATVYANKQLNSEYRKQIDYLTSERDRLLDQLNSGKDCDTYNEWKKQVGNKALSAYIEAMAGAYALETNIPPSKAVLHTSVSNDGKEILYWFEEKTPELKPVESMQVV